MTMAEDRLVGMTDRLAAIEGFDVHGSLSNLNGDVAGLARVLDRFVKVYAAGLPRLMPAVAAGDATTCWQLCHSLRGACATICATRLVQRILDVEAMLGRVPEASALAAAAEVLETELKALVERLARALKL